MAVALVMSLIIILSCKSHSHSCSVSSQNERFLLSKITSTRKVDSPVDLRHSCSSAGGLRSPDRSRWNCRKGLGSSWFFAAHPIPPLRRPLLADADDSVEPLAAESVVCCTIAYLHLSPLMMLHCLKQFN